MNGNLFMGYLGQASPLEADLVSDPWQYSKPYLYNCLPQDSPLERLLQSFLDKQPTFTERKLFKRSGDYFVSERSTREVKIGAIRLTQKTYINVDEEAHTFDAFFCHFNFGDDVKDVPITIPFRDLKRRQILQHLPPFRRNPDCPPQYYEWAFYDQLLDGGEVSYLQLPKASGFQVCGGSASFASQEIVIPQLRQYYAPDILARELTPTQETLADAAKNLAACLPDHWKYKMLLAVRITSLLLFFYAEERLKPDQIILVEPNGESNAKAVVSLLKNRHTSPVVRPLTDCKTSLQEELYLSNDATAVFRDTAYIEEQKKRNSGLNVLLHDLNECSGEEDLRRHLIVVVTDHLGAFSSELPALFLSLNGCPDVKDVPRLQKAACSFEYALIRHLTQTDRRENLVAQNIQIGRLEKVIANADHYMTDSMLRTTIEIFWKLKIISQTEGQEMFKYIKKRKYNSEDPDQAICNDFRQVLSDSIENGHIRLVNQYGAPYFDPEKASAFLDGKYINMLTYTIDRHILLRMKTTHRRNKLLHALDACGNLYHNNNFKRNIDVETAPGNVQTFAVYSVSKNIVTPRCRERINKLAYADLLFHKFEFPQSFEPVLTMGNDCIAGRVITGSSDNAESIYVSGGTRSGKTYFLAQQALTQATAGKRVIIFDQTGAFTQEELCKHLPVEVIDRYVSYWNAYQDGLPVDLLTLEHCTSLPEKKRQLLSIYSVAANVTGEVQSKLLRKCLTPIIKAIDADLITTLSDTLLFFDKDDPDQIQLRSRLEETFEELECLPMQKQNWGEFLSTQKPIVVISSADDGIRKNSTLIDMLLASLYTYKQHDRELRYTVILDELEDLCLEKDGPISTILRKGGKHRLSMLLASQEYSCDKDKLGKLIGNCDMQVFFKPKDANIGDIAKFAGVGRTVLMNLEQGECVAVGSFYSRSKQKNTHTTLKGKTYCAEQTLLHRKAPIMPSSTDPQD